MVERHRHYRLDGHEVVPCSFEEWQDWFEGPLERRVVAQDSVGAFFVSTVFLGLDHNFGTEGPALTFETMIFEQTPDGRGEEVSMQRYATWGEALNGHDGGCFFARVMMQGLEGANAEAAPRSKGSGLIPHVANSTEGVAGSERAPQRRTEMPEEL